jgi:feruloyl esterase
MPGFIIPLVGLLVLAGTAACGGGVQEPQAPAAIPAATPDPAAAERCAQLMNLELTDTVITSASIVPASGSVPEHCRVIGGIETVILFEIGLPTTTWNNRFFYAGGGGYNGTVPSLDFALSRGYAATGSDTGHRGEHWDASSLFNNPQVQINYAHRGAHLTTVMAKEVVSAYYGTPARHSYFLGCSNGGKMGHMAVQRYPDDFDGVVVGGAVVDRTKLMLMYAWVNQALLGAEIPPHKIPAMEGASLAACDANDGLEDGLIDRPDTCDFDPKVLTCKGADGPNCLTPAQVGAWQKILDGPKNSAGEQLFPGYSPGHEDDYSYYITGTGIMHGYPSSDFMYGDNFMRWVAFGPDFDLARDFDFDTSPAALVPLEKDQDAVQTDLSAFKAHGGKLIMWNGWADHSTPPLRPIEYYDDLRGVHGDDTDDFARLFMVPGFHHCSGGAGPTHFGARRQPYSPGSTLGDGLTAEGDADHDIMAAVHRWVEEGVAPEKIIATKFVNDDPEQGVARTRPLCPYPQVARYTGSGSIDDAANFACADPG